MHPATQTTRTFTLAVSPLSIDPAFLNRRTFLAASGWAALGSALAEGSAAAALASDDAKPASKSAAGKAGDLSKLAGEVGVTTSSLSGHVVEQPTQAKAAQGKPRPGKIALYDLPKFLRDEFGIRVIDLNTTTLGSFDPKHLDRFREAVEKAGATVINLKMNQRGLDMNSRDEAIRLKALETYQRSIDAAARIGSPWARPLPLAPRPDMKIHVASYRHLVDYGASRGVRMLVENYGWMESNPASVVELIKAIDRDVAASPDTGNWKNNEIRYAGLAKTFPLAVSCDFKARQLGPQGEHALYDLKRCFEIGWQAGFRGPWCLEHANRDLAKLKGELTLLTEMLRGWMKDKA